MNYELSGSAVLLAIPTLSRGGAGILLLSLFVFFVGAIAGMLYLHWELRSRGRLRASTDIIDGWLKISEAELERIVTDMPGDDRLKRQLLSEMRETRARSR